MKILKKITSLTMSAILLFTTNSALQAAKVDTAQMQEIKELRADIIKEVKGKKLYPNLPKPEEMIARHAQAVKNAEAKVEKMMAELQAKYPLTKEQEEEAKGFAEYVQNSAKNTQLSLWSIFNKYKYKGIDEKTKELIKQIESNVNKEANSKRYKKVIKNKDERKRVATSTYLFLNVKDKEAQILSDGDIACIVWLIVEGVLLLTTVTCSILLEPFWQTFYQVAETIDIIDTVATSGFIILFFLGPLIIALFSGAYTPAISPAFDEEKTLQMFTEKPFEYLADFEKKNKEFEYVNIYNKGPKAAQVLNDAVDIEYYVSANPDNLENIKDKLYIGTIDWYEMEPEARAEYLHNFAERLRTEAKAKGQEYSNAHSFRKGLAEK